jgi:hypothetical protein
MPSERALTGVEVVRDGVRSGEAWPQRSDAAVFEESRDAVQ